MFCPEGPRIIVFERPEMVMNPSGSMVQRSPVFIQPSASGGIASAVAFGFL